MVTTAFGDYAIARSVRIQDNGKIVVAGISDTGGAVGFALLRYNSDGTLDTSFNGSGKVITNFPFTGNGATCVTLQRDGKIIAVGSAGPATDYDLAVVRYNSDGSLDTSFNGIGKLTTAVGSSQDGAASVAVQSDGYIVVAGYAYNAANNYDFAVVRYEGDLDTDGDGLLDRNETGTGIYVSPQDTGTSPTNADTDGDGLNDGAEVNTYHSNPHVRDTDSDGFDDGFEVSIGFSPTAATSTPDALSTILTAVEYRFNAANGISYRIEASIDVMNWTTIETNIIGSGGAIIRLYSIDGQQRRFFRSRRN